MHLVEGTPPPRSSAVVNCLWTLHYVTIPGLIGKRIGQFRLGQTLGLSQKKVADLEKLPEKDLPPYVRLAVEYIEAVGFDVADELPDPEPADLEEITSAILLPREQIAALLGKRRQVLYSLTTGSDQETVKRVYLLALLRLRQLYGLTDEAQAELSSRMRAGEYYRDRRSRDRAPLRLVKVAAPMPRRVA